MQVRTTRCLVLIFTLALTAIAVSAQVQTGNPPFGSFGGGPDIINLANLNSHIAIPVLHKAGRGLPFTYDLSYDSSVWYPVTSGGTTSWQPVGNWGWRGVTEAQTGSTSSSGTSATCMICNGFTCYYPVGQVVVSNWVYHDAWGVPHSFSGSAIINTGNCPQFGGPNSTGFTSTAVDGSGYTLTVTGSTNSASISQVVTGSDGRVMNGPYNSSSGAGSGTDRNGNQITVNSSGVFTDTLGTTALTVSGAAPNPVTFTYTAPSGASASYTMKYTTYTVQTNFGCGINEYGPISNNLVSEMDLPDWNASTNPNSKYTFAYESTPGHSGFVTGRLASVTLPTGGTITYTYTGGSSGHITCSDGSTAGLQRAVNDGANNNTWTYSRIMGTAPASATLITAPRLSYDSAANQTFLQFQGIYETQRDVYQGSAPTITSLPVPESTLLTAGLSLEMQTCYNSATSPCTGTGITLPITQRTLTNQIGSSGSISKRSFTYTTYGLLSEEDDYDYGSSGAGSLLKKTLITYASLGSNLNAFSQTVTICNGAGSSTSCNGTGTPVARTDTNYDQYSSFTGSNCITGAPQHDDSGHGCSFTARANATSVTTYTNPSAPSGGITQNLTYDSLGNLRTATDALNNTTTLAYNPDAWANTACNPASTSYAYPVSATNALNQVTNFKYYACTGQLASVKDPNNQPTTVSYDSLLRPTEEDFPDTGRTIWSYTGQTSIQTTTKMNSTQNIVSTLLLDGLGRAKQSQLNSDTQGVDYTDTTYDLVGRVASVSNPYRSTSDPTYGLTSYQYDALSRITKVIPPDGSSSANNISATYSNNVTTVTDQAGKKRQSAVDGLGRLTQVTEDPGGLGYATSYGYDALSNLVSVTQNGGRTRTFTYDALSRLVCESNPEIQIATCPNPDNGSYTAGTIRYTYDNGGNLTSRQEPAPNQTGSATVTTTYSWDALHRLTSKSYSDGVTPSVGFGYDESSIWGATLLNPIGRLTHTAIASTAYSALSYDSVGRTLNEWQWTPYNWNTSVSGSWPVGYSYDLAGDMTSYSNGVGITFTQSFNTSGRPTGLTSSLVDSQHPGTLATVDSTLGYYPHGGIHKATLGNGLTSTNVFNNTLQPCLIDVNNNGTVLQTCNDSTPTGNVLDFWMGYNSGTSNNGNVVNWNSTGNQSFVRTFGYDSLNRLSTLNQSSGNATGCSATYNLSWTYDAWGNRTDQTHTAGTCGEFHATVNTKNQLVDPVNNLYQYDAAGNMIHDASHTYFYDAENRLAQVDGTFGNCSTATACFTYDALGRRAEKTTGSTKLDYIYDLAGNAFSEWCTNCGGYTGPTTEYIFMSGRFVAEYKNNTTYFVHQDHLGSARLLTGLDQSVVQNLDYLPFGELNSSDSGITTHKFTGDERDSETGLDHTWFRQYSSSLGRWMHADPAGLAAVDITNPQSWNRYAYVMNDPIDFVDPSGLTDCPQGKTCGDPWNQDPNWADWSGLFGRDLLGCAWADFWGGDCATENRKFSGFLTRSDAVLLPYPWGQCMETTGDYVCWNNVDVNYFLYGGRGGAGGGGFTLGIRVPGQSYGQCLNANSSNYSIGGVTGTDNFLLTNDISQLAFGDRKEGAVGLAVWEGGSHSFEAGVGTVMTAGRRTASITSMNLAGTTGPAARILAKTGAEKLAGWLTGVAELKLAADIGLTGAEAIGCLVPR